MEPGEEAAKSAQVEQVDETLRRALDDQAEAIAPGSERESGERIERSEVDDPDVGRVADEVNPDAGRERQVCVSATTDDADRFGGLAGAR
ncbi:MAG: hypothetical protein M3Q66_05220 [Chloroflexota bacterium]|nr:hypothetical protein [Chloroflexota bacterium]